MTTSLRGKVERVTYHNEENLYTVLRVRQEDGPLATVVGHFAALEAGEDVAFTGEWVQHPEYGRQFRADGYETVRPATVEGIENYLASGLIKGIGTVTAQRIVGHFGLETLNIIEKEPERLTEVPGIGPSKAARLAEALKSQSGIREVMVFLQGHGVTPALAAKIYKTYGEDSVARVQANPYQLATDVFGIGFRTADRIARAIGVGSETPARIEAGLSYCLGEFSQNGHMYAPRPLLEAEAAKMLDADPDLVRRAVDDGIAHGTLVRDYVPMPGDPQANDPEDPDGAGSGSGWEGLAEVGSASEAIYLAPFYAAEAAVAQRLISLSGFPALTLPLRASSEALGSEGAEAIRLAECQLQAVEQALSQSVLVITGGPGTGKTTTLNSIIRHLEAGGLSVVLAAPTGRAAKRMTEATHREAKTLHRLLEYAYVEGSGMQFQRNELRPLDGDAVVVDEVSMVDCLLMYHLLKAIRPGTRLILVGDVDQLPPVGPGNVLKDVIASGVIPTVRLTEIFRQAGESRIVVNAHLINQGRIPHLNEKEKDFFLVEEQDPERVADLVVELVKDRLPAHIGCTPDEIQVLSPMRRLSVGVENLNRRLQEALNPASPAKAEVQAGGVTFRVGDKVMQMRNNYQKGVFNGDIGWVSAVDVDEDMTLVTYPDYLGERDVPYERAELDELALSYAVTVHKSQGSEYPVVVLPLVTQHYVMLQRNLLYTAVTRAKRFVVLVGSRRAVLIAVRNNRLELRYTGLSHRLRQLAGLSD